MESKVIYRKLKKGDFKELEEIIKETWEYEKFADKKTAGKLARAYLFSCLANQTYSLAAEKDGEAVGIILGKKEDHYRCPVSYKIRQFISVCSLAVTDRGRHLMKFYGDIDTIYEKLYSRCNKRYGGEVALFAVKKECRGLGIGKQLFERMEAYMRTEKINDIYLYTDTSCNYGFYEHQGMLRKQEEKQKAEINGKKIEIMHYLYDKKLS